VTGKKSPQSGNATFIIQSPFVKMSKPSIGHELARPGVGWYLFRRMPGDIFSHMQEKLEFMWF
jgi:hypothetical protein